MKTYKKEEWLEENTRTNRNIALFLLVIGLVTLIFYGLGLIFILISLYFFKNYSNYNKGKTGEAAVENELKELDDNYILLNDVNLPGSYGNIDHIVMGPNGIFVLETKNFAGDISCNGDNWNRHYQGGLKLSRRGNFYWASNRDYGLGSPSKQAKRNAVTVKNLLKNKVDRTPWIQSAVIFPNSNTYLTLNNPSVPVLRLGEIATFIKDTKSRRRYSNKEIKDIAKRLLEADLNADTTKIDLDIEKDEQQSKKKERPTCTIIEKKNENNSPKTNQVHTTSSDPEWWPEETKERRKRQLK